MNAIFRKSLLAGAVAALAASPVLAGGEAGKTHDQSGTYQHMERSETWKSDKHSRSEMGASSQVQAMTPSQLRGTEVVGPGGEEVGSVAAVVRSRQDKNIQAVISAGGVLGMGDREVAVPLDSLRYDGEKLRISSTEEQLKARPEYKSEQFVELEPTDQPISEFSAFETVPDESRSTWERPATGTPDRGDAMRDPRPYPLGDRVTP